jgi:selenide,water dikinase
LFNANRKGLVSEAALSACLDTITALNRAAAEVLHGYTVHACTDVTGFGLAGHGYEMAHGSGVSLSFDLDALPVMDEALAMYQRGVTTGVNATNRELVQAHLRFARELPVWRQEIVFDPQTSGGLLAALPADEAEAALRALHAAGVGAACIVGEVLPLQAEHLLFR